LTYDLTFELDYQKGQNEPAYLERRSLSSKVIVRAHTHTPGRVVYLDHQSDL